MTFDFDTSRALRTGVARRALVCAVRDAQSGDVETDWLEWKTALDLSKRDTHFEIARQVLGFANREPDRSSRVAEGCAYLLLGLEPANLRGVTPIDPAELEKNVNAYVGLDGPAWDSHYETVDGRVVLVVSMEAPRWGDPIHPLLREFGGHKAGTIFVRRPGRTDVADPAAIRILSNRARRAPEHIAVNLEYAAEPPTIPAVDDLPDVIHRLLIEERNANSVQQPGGPRDGDPRQDMQEMMARRRTELPRELLERLAAVAPPIQLRLVNSTDRNLRAVQVRAEVIGKVAATTDFRYSPVYYTTAPFDYSLQSTPPIPSPRVIHSNDEDAARLYFQDEDLRPRYTVLLETFRLAAAGTLAGTTLSLRWYATASNTDGIAEGELPLQVQHFATPVDASNE